MSQRYIDNAERSKQKENQQGILKNLRIMLENSAEGLGPGESARERCWGYVSVYENTLKVAATLYSGPGKDAVGA